MSEIYDNELFFSEYRKMERSIKGLKGAGEWHQLKDLIPPLKGKKVLDLGSGYGWHSKYAIECGASSVLAIDISEKMLEKAKEINASPYIEYRHCSIEEYEYPREMWDFVISNLALHYVDNISDIFQKVYKTLMPSGIFLFNIEHPTFTAGVNQEWIYDSNHSPLYWPVDNYFIPGERTTTFLGCKVKKYHHTLTQILMGLINSGFTLEAIEEATPSKEMLEIEGMKDELRRPMMLLVRARK